MASGGARVPPYHIIHEPYRVSAFLTHPCLNPAGFEPRTSRFSIYLYIYLSISCSRWSRLPVALRQALLLPPFSATWPSTK